MNLQSSLAGVALVGALALTTSGAAQPILGGPWSGFYVGGHLGAAFDANNLTFSDLSSAQDLSSQSKHSGDQFLGGLQAGYDWQAGNLLVGVEGDVSFAKDIDYLSTIRGRLGFPAGPFLIYGTGGAAFEGAHEHFTVFQPDSPAIYNFSRSANKTGWTAGGGIETFVAPAVSVGVEGLYYSMGHDDTVLTVPNPPIESFAVRDDHNFTVVRARLTYHLGL